jgi:hypothetical protein
MEYENNIHHPDADAVMERVRRALTAIAHLTAKSEMDSNRPKYGGYQEECPRASELYSALHRVYTEVLHDLTAVLKESAAKGERAKTTITAPPSIEEFCKQRRRKRKPTNDADKRAKKRTISTTGVNDPKLQSKPKIPTRKFFAPLRSAEIEAEHGDGADDTTDRQQHQADPARQVGRLPLHKPLK